MLESLKLTPFQESADNACQASWNNWENSEIFPSIGNSLYARLGYLVDMVASVVLIPFALIGCVFGTFQAIFLWDESRATLLTDSYTLFIRKIERLFTSALGAVISPALGLYFRDRAIRPMAIGLILTGLASYMVLKSPPQKFDWTFGLGK